MGPNSYAPDDYDEHEGYDEEDLYDLYDVDLFYDPFYDPLDNPYDGSGYYDNPCYEDEEAY